MSETSEKAAYIRRLKNLLKKYHPDLCRDEHLKKNYNEITVRLNTILDQLKTDEKNSVPLKQDYAYYRLGIKYYKNIHPDRFFKRNPDKTYETKSYTEQLKALNNILTAFTLSEYFFSKVTADFPHSPWADDAQVKIGLLKKLYKSYANLDIQEGTQIINTGEFVNAMGLKPLF
jgi:outer membrane protein assembly factor BamD (BamD/ComL family)